MLAELQSADQNADQEAVQAGGHLQVKSSCGESNWSAPQSSFSKKIAVGGTGTQHP